MKRSVYLLLLVVFAPAALLSQNVAINGTGAAADPSALLEIDAPDKGLLIPRVALTGTADVTTVPGSATSLLVYNTATAGNVTPGFYYWNGTAWVRLDDTAGWSLTGNAGTNPSTNYLGTTDATNLSIRTNAGERIVVTSGGLVGVNIPAPSDYLHVGGNVRVGAVNPPNSGTFPDFGRRLYFSGGPSSAVYNSDNSDPIWMARYNGAQDVSELRMNLSDNCNTQDAFVIQSGGSGCALNTARFRFDSNGGAFKPGGGSWAALSDRRLKQNISDYDGGLAEIMQVRPVTYQYNGEGNTQMGGPEYVGVIAQEVKEVAPYMVGETGEYFHVDPTAFTYMLINAVQEQQKEINELKLELDKRKELEGEVDALKAEMAQIRTYLEQASK